MSRWGFNRFRPGDRARNSQVEKFFQSDDIADRTTAVVREGIQNSLDAATEGSINVRISIGELPADALEEFTAELFEHLDGIRNKVESLPERSEPVRYLAFEDFNTKGLEGDPEQWEPHPGVTNPFFNFFRGEGVSDKSTDARGRHGVGKMVFAVASRARCLYGLSVTRDGKPRLMGTATLLVHKRKGTTYHPDGWFGIEKRIAGGVDTLIVPNTDRQTIRQFSAAFQLEREELPGLSIVVPWLHPEITCPGIIKAVLSGYFWPILQSKLFVDVVDGEEVTTINAQTMDTVIASLAEEDRQALEARIRLARWAHQLPDKEYVKAGPAGSGAQNWSHSQLSMDDRSRIARQLDRGENVAVKIPILIKEKYVKQAKESEFRVYLQKAADCHETDVSFFREGLLVSGVRPARRSGYRGLVIIEEGALGTFLGDAENPSHTLWQKENVRAKYSYHDSCLKYVINSPVNILKALSEEDRKADPFLLIDVFSLPAPQEQSVRQATPRKQAGGKSLVAAPEIKTVREKRFLLRRTANGFVVVPGNVARPERLEIEMAYGVRRGNPFEKYDPADFNLSEAPISFEVKGGRVVSAELNRLVVDLHADDFLIEVSGFDVNRDLHINPRIRQQELEHAAEI